MSRSGPLVAFLAFAAIGCSVEKFPGPPYFEQCTTDADCAPNYQCLAWKGFGPGYGDSGSGFPTVCTIPCTTRDECPRVVTEHCGEGTSCYEGVCGHGGCR